MTTLAPLARILKALGKQAPRSSADLRADLQAIDMAGLEAAVADLEKQRKALLLTGTDAQLADNDRGIVAANLAAERAQAATEELQRQIADAEAREAAEQIEDQSAEAERATAKLALIYSEIDSRAVQIKALLADAAAPVATLARWNKLAEKIGKPDRRISYVDPVAAKQRMLGAFR